MQIVNIAAYRFIPLPAVQALREPIKSACVAHGLKGTVLIAPEGINLFLAGFREGIDGFLAAVADDSRLSAIFDQLPIKESYSDKQPFRRMLVRIKKEIITMKCPAIAPAEGRAPAVAPATLARWLDQGQDDDGRPVLLLDTRNAFEVALGSFKHALDFEISRFSEFPDAYGQAVKAGRIDPKTQHIVTFCTGGIRCEKAAIYLAEQGALAVTQLDGGILKYFETCGGAHWQGECFVFDDRVALDPDLLPTDTVQCYACRSIVSVAEQSDPRYVLGESCPHCAKVREAIPAE
jgi:UPF0176 protein